jgi:hypothetical protein
VERQGLREGGRYRLTGFCLGYCRCKQFTSPSGMPIEFIYRPSSFVIVSSSWLCDIWGGAMSSSSS